MRMVLIMASDLGQIMDVVVVVGGWVCDNPGIFGRCRFTHMVLYLLRWSLGEKGGMRPNLTKSTSIYNGSPTLFPMFVPVSVVPYMWFGFVVCIFCIWSLRVWLSLSGSFIFLCLKCVPVFSSFSPSFWLSRVVLRLFLLIFDFWFFWSWGWLVGWFVRPTFDPETTSLLWTTKEYHHLNEVNTCKFGEK